MRQQHNSQGGTPEEVRKSDYGSRHIGGLRGTSFLLSLAAIPVQPHGRGGSCSSHWQSVSTAKLARAKRCGCLSPCVQFCVAAYSFAKKTFRNAYKFFGYSL